MSDEIRSIVIEATTRLFEDRLDEQAVRQGRSGVWLAEAWAAVENMGLPLALVGEEAGGLGLAPEDAFELVRLTGRHAIPLPIAETMVANHALAAAGLPLAEGPAVLVPGGLTIAAGRLTGTVERAPWGRNAATLVVEVNGGFARLTEGWSLHSTYANAAGMPRDTLVVDAAAPELAPMGSPSLMLAGAAIRALQMSGAIAKALEMSVVHVNERVQFGRTLGKFQVVQHELAKVAGQLASSNAAADLAVDAYLTGGPEAFVPVAAARVRIGEAVGETVSICQQMHGAIGFTREHALHLYTTALFGWRDEYGGHVYWSKRLGDAALSAGPEGFWPFICAA